MTMPEALTIDTLGMHSQQKQNFIPLSFIFFTPRWTESAVWWSGGLAGLGPHGFLTAWSALGVRLLPFLMGDGRWVLGLRGRYGVGGERVVGWCDCWIVGRYPQS